MEIRLYSWISSWMNEYHHTSIMNEYNHEYHDKYILFNYYDPLGLQTPKNTSKIDTDCNSTTSSNCSNCRTKCP